MIKKTYVSIPYMLLGILFCVCLIAANILDTKQIEIFKFPLTAGLIVFPVSYIINDCLVEVWGYRPTRLIIWVGFAMNALFVLFGFLADALPGASFWTNDQGFHQIFGLAPRIVLGSFIAFIIGSFLNAYVMSVMKVRNKGKYFSLRAIMSTVVGETADSLVFFPIALGGVVPWKAMPAIICGQVILKILYEILVLPITIMVVKYLKKKENIDTYDKDISYDIFRVRDM